MSKFDEWAAAQWAGMKQGAMGIGSDFVSEVGNTYQAILMSDAGWRVPRAHDGITQEIAEQAAAAELEQEFAEPAPDLGPSHDIETDR
jgi:hypothetical protein